MMPLRQKKLWCAAGAAVAVLLLTAASALGAPAIYKGASATGDVVFFESDERLVAGDTDGKRDIFVRLFDPDVEGGTYLTRQISTGLTGGNDAYSAVFEGNSPDGERVFFSTEEPLVEADKDKRTDVYMRDLSGFTVLLSVAAPSCTGTCGNSETASANFVGASGDGEVVFYSTNEQLDGEDGDAAFDVYARDLDSEETELVSAGATNCVCGDESTPAVFEGSSEDGSTAYFTTSESLAAADDDPFQDIYRRDLLGDSTTLVSPSGNCPAGLECDAVLRGINPAGTSAFFLTVQPIDAADGDEASDLYAWSASGVALASRPDPSCGACVNEEQPVTFSASSADGTKVVFQTSESLVAADGDEATDVYRDDLSTGATVLLSPEGICPLSACNAEYRAASANASLVLFQTTERLDVADGDAARDIYLRDVDAGTTTLVSVAAAGCAGCGAGDVDAKFADVAAELTKVFFSSAEPLVASDEDEALDIYQRDLAGTPVTLLGTPGGVCPLGEEQGCDASFEDASEDGARLVFSTVERLSVDDVDSELDIYQRADGKTRLISTGNSVELGPSTPILTATSPASPNPSLEPWVMGQSDPGTSIKIYSSPDCSGAPVRNGVGTAAALMGSGIRVTVLPGSTTIFRATATDANGDTSGCSAAGLNYQQAEAPAEPPAELPTGETPGTGDTPAGGVGSSPASSGGSTSGTGSKAGGERSIGEARPLVPQTRITFGPASRTRARRPVFRFTDATGQSGTEFRCRIDNGRWKGCSSPYRAKQLRPGRHSFSVKGTNSGLIELRPVSRRFQVVTR